jgi:hypothetical protein
MLTFIVALGIRIARMCRSVFGVFLVKDFCHMLMNKKKKMNGGDKETKRGRRKEETNMERKKLKKERGKDMERKTGR